LKALADKMRVAAGKRTPALPKIFRPACVRLPNLRALQVLSGKTDLGRASAASPDWEENEN